MDIAADVKEIRVPQFPVDHVLLNRWSPRAFSDRPVTDEVLGEIFEGARWAMSSYNEQPWRFIVAKTPAEVARFTEVLIPANQVWAKNAPVLVVSVAKTNFSHNDTPNRVAVHDVGAASAYFTLAAAQHGVRTHGMAGFDLEAARKALEIPEGYEPVAVWAIGYQGDIATLPPEYQAREQVSDRKQQSEFVFEGKFGG